jgi:hypothetical protein
LFASFSVPLAARRALAAHVPVSHRSRPAGFYTYQGIAGCTYSDQFIQFRLNCRSIPVLRILNHENHEEGNNRRARVDDKLPSVGEMKQWARDCPE